MAIWQKAWARWKIIGGVVANYQARAIALFFYYTIMVPFGLGMRLFADPLQLKPSRQDSLWVARDGVSSSVEDARRQW